MENASKALIIAGAILLAILLISLGILVYNNARGTITDANLDSETAQAFNTRISQYCGNRKSANDMNSLIDAISASNGAQNSVAATERHYIAVDATDNNMTGYVSGGTSVTVTVSGIGSAATQTINQANGYPRFSSGLSFEATYTTDANGYINKVTIKKQL